MYGLVSWLHEKAQSPNQNYFRKGRKQVGALSSAERGLTMTRILLQCIRNVHAANVHICQAANETNCWIDPPAGAWAECHAGGWRQGQIFLSCFKRFT